MMAAWVRVGGVALAALLAARCAQTGASRTPVAAPTPRGPDMTPLLRYPDARRGDVIDTYHGVEVADPYRWLEDPDSAETRAWTAAENALTFTWLEQVAARPWIRDRLTRLWDYEKHGLPFKEGGRYFFSHNPGLLNQAQIFTATRLDEAPRLLLDPNSLAADGTVAVTGLAPSPDGKRVAYSLSRAGSDWQEWRLRDVATARDLEDQVSWSKFSGASWARDGSGFYYSAYDPPADRDQTFTGANYFHKLYFHRVGTPQATDRLIYQRADHKEWGFDGQVSDDGQVLILHVWDGTNPKNGLFYQDLTSPGDAPAAGFVELLKDFDALYRAVGKVGPILYLRTDLQAPRGRVVAIDLRKPEREAWREVIPQLGETLDEVTLAGGHLVAHYLKDAHSLLRVHDLQGRLLREAELPGLGTVALSRAKADDVETFYSYESYTQAPIIFRLDVASGAQEVFRRTRVDFDSGAYETRQVFFPSKDGTRVPMFITHRRGLQLDKARPTYLYGYGGFNISLTPTFSASAAVWLEMGGVFAVANLRGGGEYGEDWHLAGTGTRKQNVFDDFIAAAEWLIAQGYTTPRRLAIGGGSNGGLLVGACLTQRPDLFGAALLAVGVLDMLRYHTWTIGWAWASDYGTAEDPDVFPALRAYSPYHNLRVGQAYPATLITTADHDDRVVPAHSFKFAAALQHAQAGPAPILIRIETRAGHGAGKPTAKIIEETSDRWAFLSRVFDMEVGRDDL